MASSLSASPAGECELIWNVPESKRLFPSAKRDACLLLPIHPLNPLLHCVFYVSVCVCESVRHGVKVNHKPRERSPPEEEKICEVV